MRDVTHPGDLDKDRKQLGQMLGGTGALQSYQVEKRYLHKNGHQVWVLLSVVLMYGSQGQPLHFVSEIQDITERKQIEAMRMEAHESLVRVVQEQSDDNTTLHLLALTDGLTGLHNRRSFEESLSREFDLAKRSGGALSLLLLDVDHFKSFNDTFGHPAGDVVLQRVAQLLTTIARSTDMVARCGGEEFAVILPDTDREGAAKLAERFRQTIENESWKHRPITASFGVCTLRQETGFTTSSALIDEADKALYQSKSSGRNCVTCVA